MWESGTEVHEQLNIEQGEEKEVIDEKMVLFAEMERTLAIKAAWHISIEYSSLVNL